MKLVVNEFSPLIRNERQQEQGFAISFQKLLYGGIILIVIFVFGNYHLPVDAPILFAETSTCTWRIDIIRHAERYTFYDSDGTMHRDLTEFGKSRAQYLADNSRILFPGVKSIYATKPSPPKNAMTEIHTAQPIAESLGLPLHSEFSRTKSDTDLMRQQIFSNSKCGENVLIVWDHKNMAWLIDYFGGCIKKWHDNDFSSRITLTFDADNDLLSQQVTTESYPAGNAPNPSMKIAEDFTCTS